MGVGKLRLQFALGVDDLFGVRAALGVALGVRAGDGRGGAGQRLLMARRLVENGVRYVTVSLGSWYMALSEEEYVPS